MRSLPIAGVIGSLVAAPALEANGHLVILGLQWEY